MFDVTSTQRIHSPIESYLSKDLRSDSLKTKRHYNSFASPFLISARDVIRQLLENGSLKVDSEKSEELLKKAMKCLNCGEEIRNIPNLKMHQSVCRYKFRKIEREKGEGEKGKEREGEREE